MSATGARNPGTPNYMNAINLELNKSQIRVREKKKKEPYKNGLL